MAGTRKSRGTKYFGGELQEAIRQRINDTLAPQNKFGINQLVQLLAWWWVSLTCQERAEWVEKYKMHEAKETKEAMLGVPSARRIVSAANRKAHHAAPIEKQGRKTGA